MKGCVFFMLEVLKESLRKSSQEELQLISESLDNLDLANAVLAAVGEDPELDADDAKLEKVLDRIPETSLDDEITDAELEEITENFIPEFEF